MVKKDEDLDELDELEDEEEEEEEPEEEPKRKGRKKRAVEREKENDNWQLQRFPEVVRVINPKTKEVIAQAGSIEELQIQLLVLTAQNSAETVKNTR